MSLGKAHRDDRAIRIGGNAMKKMRKILYRFVPGSYAYSTHDDEDAKEEYYARPLPPARRWVSIIGGIVLIIAFLILVLAWAWHDRILSGDAPSTGDALKLSDDMWNLGVIVAVLGAIAVAFDSGRKRKGF